MKTCTKCGETKPLDAFNKCKAKKDGYHSYCRQCNSEYLARYRKEQGEALLEKKRQSYQRHKEKHLATNKAWREANKERKKKADREWREHNKERKAALDRAWYLANKERANRNRRNYVQRWPERNLARVMARRAAKLQRTPPWANMDAIREIYETRLPGEEVDHIVPLQGETVSGLHCEANLQHLPADENRSKSNKYWPDMW